MKEEKGTAIAKLFNPLKGKINFATCRCYKYGHIYANIGAVLYQMRVVTYN